MTTPSASTPRRYWLDNDGYLHWEGGISGGVSTCTKQTLVDMLNASIGEVDAYKARVQGLLRQMRSGLWSASTFLGSDEQRLTRLTQVAGDCIAAIDAELEKG